MQNRQSQVHVLRLFRKIHKISGLTLMLFLLITAFTGVLLGWKKNSNGIILADTAQGTSSNMEAWLSIYELNNRTLGYVRDSLKLEPQIDRIDVRPDKGVIKYTFKNCLYGIQIDATNGRILVVEKRYADIIERIHDGSIVDNMLGLKSGIFKLVYTSILSLGLILFCITGFWLWYGPKILKR